MIHSGIPSRRGPPPPARALHAAPRRGARGVRAEGPAPCAHGGRGARDGGLDRLALQLRREQAGALPLAGRPGGRSRGAARDPPDPDAAARRDRAPAPPAARRGDAASVPRGCARAATRLGPARRARRHRARALRAHGADARPGRRDRARRDRPARAPRALLPRREPFAKLARYVERRARSGHFASVGDPVVATRFIVESVAWFSRHRFTDPDPKLLPEDDTVRTEVVNRIVASFVPA